MTASAATVLIADEHAIVRAELRAVVDAEPDLEVVAEAADGAHALARALAAAIDVVVLDVRLPRLMGLDVARLIIQERPAAKVLILSLYDDDRYRAEALRAGASAFVVKSAAARELVPACRAILRGERLSGSGRPFPASARSRSASP
jgi:DNA-binding NarL/FixJ family response regulator